jgi:hypothetical protein
VTLAHDLPGALPAALPQLRVVPAPPSAPPYDDEPARPPRLRLVAPPREPLEVDESVWFTDDRTPTAELPDARAFTAVLLRGLVEVLHGARPLAQLRMQTTVELYAELAERLQGGRHRAGGRPDARCVGSVHTQERPEGVVEANATLRLRGRVTAVALRLEGFGGRWVCTDLEGL